MRNIAIVNYAGKTIYAVSVFDNFGLVNLYHSEHGRVFENGYSMQEYVLNLLFQNGIEIHYEVLFNAKMYDIVWCNVSAPENQDQFFFTKTTALGESLTSSAV